MKIRCLYKSFCIGVFLLALFPFPRVWAFADELAKGNNAFAFDLFQHLGKQSGNIFVSPFSISTALAMTFAGSRTETAKEMGTVLHLPKDKVHPLFKALLESLDGRDKPYQLHVANALWGRKGSEFLPGFLSGVEEFYHGKLQKMDFAGDTEGARQAINKWVEEKTEQKIKELLIPGILSPETKLVLTNAIYFKGTWLNTFEKDLTKDQDFFTASGTTQKVPLMEMTAQCLFLEEKDFQALELPYTGKDLSMVVLLPRTKDGLPALEATLSQPRWQEILTRLAPETDVQIFLPRFKVTLAMFLGETLQALGMKLAFGNADFSGIDGTKSMSISEVIHKAFVEVNEEGTEAAAATAVEMSDSFQPEGPKPAPVFRADHPFFFVIRHKPTDSILFMGRLASPTQ